MNPTSELMSVIIPTHDRCQSLRYTLLSLSRQTFPADQTEVLVLDNGSEDGTAEMLRSFTAPFRLRTILVPKQKPFESSRLRNLGMASAKGDVLVFFDSDMIAPPHFLEQHAAVHTYADDIALLGKMFYLESNEGLSEGVFTSAFSVQALGPMQLAGKTVNRFLSFSGNLRQYLRPWDLCIGANFSVTRAGIDRAGGFDETLDGEHPAGADIAYGMQMYSRGLKLVYGRAALAFHQKNNPTHWAAAPAYFEQRQRSVFLHEQMLYEHWLDTDMRAAVRSQLAGKRAMNALIDRFGLTYTMEVEKRDLTRLTILASSEARPALTIFIIADGRAEELSSALAWFSELECSAMDFEVIVLDPEAATDESQSDHDATRSTCVQYANAAYTLRYFPTGRKQFYDTKGSLGELWPHLETSAAQEPVAAARKALKAEYTHRITSLLLEKPLAQLSLSCNTSRFDLNAARIRDLIHEIKSLAPEEIHARDYSTVPLP